MQWNTNQKDPSQLSGKGEETNKFSFKQDPAQFLQTSNKNLDSNWGPNSLQENSDFQS